MSSQAGEVHFVFLQWQPLGHGIHSVVWRARKTGTPSPDVSTNPTNTLSDPVNELSQWVAVKVVHDNRSMPPHDVVREAAILRAVSHPNIISLMTFIQGGLKAPYALYMPLIPLPLTTLLSSPLFTPTPLTGPYYALSRPIFAPHEGSDEANPFNVVVRSLVFQLILAIAYLHSLDPPIAHRDINPGNVLVDHEGVVKLIDFGIAWTTGHVQTASSHEVTRESDSSRRHPFDGWTETLGRMCCEVATGPYRAPELLFSPRSYSATATDLWSLGTTIAQFFTPLRLVPSQSPLSSPTSAASDEAEHPATRPFLISSSLMTNIDYRATWERISLFNGDRGELGLAWSIFKLRGTPNEETWPTFNSLPDVNKIEFQQASRKPLHMALPHLPLAWNPVDSIDDTFIAHLAMHESPVSLIDALLAYPPESRLSAAHALNHGWFSEVILPHSHPGYDSMQSESAQSRNGKSIIRWRGRTLGEWLNPAIRREATMLIRNGAPDL